MTSTASPTSMPGTTAFMTWVECSSPATDRSISGRLLKDVRHVQVLVHRVRDLHVLHHQDLAGLGSGEVLERVVVLPLRRGGNRDLGRVGLGVAERRLL